VAPLSKPFSLPLRSSASLDRLRSKRFQSKRLQTCAVMQISTKSVGKWKSF